MPLDDRAAYGLCQSIWFHADAALHYEVNKRSATAEALRRCLGMVPEPQRSFRLHISCVFGLRSLSDFRLEGEAWPTRDDFVRRHIDFMHWQVIPGVQMQWLRVLYREATQIVERLGALDLVRDSSNASQQRLLPRLGCMSGTRTCLIPSIPKSVLLSLVWTPTPPKKPHPMTIFSTSVDEHRIKEFVDYGKHLRKILLPVYEDLQFRLAFRLLPVRSRFWFLEASRPGIRICVRDGCGAIETEQHLFFDCVLASQLWRQVIAVVSPLFAVRPGWLDIALASKLRVRTEWEEHADVVRDAWHVLRASTLHVLWGNRNRCLFDGRRPLPAAPALAVVFATFVAHVRFFRRWLYDDDGRCGLSRVLKMMTHNSAFDDYLSRQSGCTSVRSNV